MKYNMAAAGMTKTAVYSLLLVQLELRCCLASAAPDLDPMQVGVSGETRSIVVQGQYAYCELGSLNADSTSDGLRIFDVSNPTNPVPVGFYEPRTTVTGLAVSGSHAYLTTVGSLLVIDVSNPVNPRLAGRYDGSHGIWRLVVNGNYAYIAGTILQIVDVSDPANPHLVGTYGGSGKNVVGVSVAGGYAYLADNSGTTDPATPGFEVLDISNPAAPQRVGGYGIHLPTHVFAFGNYAYVGWGRAGGELVDISDPLNPQFVRNTQITSFVVSGSRGYTTDFDGLGILDLSDPANPPQLIARYTLGRYDLKAKPFISGNYAYLAAGTEGLLIVNIGDFVPPSEWKGRYEVGGPGFNGACISGNTAYVGSESGEFHVVDISNPATPQRLGSTNGLGEIESIFVSGNYAYLADQPRWDGTGSVGGGLQVIDVSNPAAPQPIGRKDTPGRAQDVVLSGNHAFVADWQGGLQVINVSNPDQPQLVWEDRSSSASGVFVSSNLVFVAGEGLRVFDASNPASPQLVGSLTNASYLNVFVVGPYAYLVGDLYPQSVLDVVDISSPSNPHRVGRCLLKGSGQGSLYVSGNRAFITGGWLQAVDVSDPTNPLVLGIYDTFGSPRDVFVSEPHAYLPDGSGMQILDVSLPPSPKTLAGEFDTSHDAVNVVISGNRAITGNGWSGQYSVLDISDLENPLRLGSYAVIGYAGVGFFSGDYAFLTAVDATGHAGEVQILDVSDPALPEVVGDISANSSIRDVFVSGGHAHVATERDGVQVFEVSNPANPQRVGSYSTNAPLWGLFVSGNYSYVWSEAGAAIFNVSDPSDPQWVALLSTNSLINSVVVSGNYAYVGASDGLEVYDVSDPASPQRVGGHAGGFGRIIVSGGLAYVSSGRLDIYDVSDPTQPRQVGIYPLISVNALAISGDHAFVTVYPSDTLQVVNIRRLANPQRVGAFTGLSASAVRGGVSVSGRKAFVADGTNGLQVLDVSDPANPQRIGGYDTPGSAEDVVVSGNHAFVADWYGGLQVINVSNPDNPLFMASVALPDHEVGVAEVAERVVVSGNYAYVTGFALHVVDVSNPASPQLAGSWVGNYLFPPNFYDVFVSGSFACVAAEGVGLLVFDVSNPGNPRFFGSYGGGDTRGVHVVGQYAYVMDRIFGLYVLDLSNPLQPRRVGGNPNIGDLLSFGATDLTAVGDKVYALAGERGLVILDLFRDPNALRLEALRPLTPGSFRFLLHGPPGFSGRIQRSANLGDWTDWQQFNLGALPFEFSDPTVSSDSHKFYRAVSP